MNNQRFPAFSNVFDPKIIAEQNDKVLKRLFKERIKGNFLINMKNRVMKELGIENFMQYYDLRWSNERMITDLGEAAEYDICRMIVGIHKAHSIFLSDDKRMENEKSEKYRQQIISETIEKIKLRPYGSVYFRKKQAFVGEEFLYYPLPYELFAVCMKMLELNNDIEMNNWQLYYGIIQNAISALSLMEDNLFGGAYSLCRGAIELYPKLLILGKQEKGYKWYEKFRMFEIEQSCHRTYPQEFDMLFEKRICRKINNKADYLHYGWADFIDGYHEVVGKYPYSVNGIITYIKCKDEARIPELERLERFYKSCHAYTHGSIQMSKYPVLHYFEISIMLYYIIRGTFLLLCEEKCMEPMIDGMDIISMADRDCEIICSQYDERSTEKFESYYKGLL